jgi:phosphoribosylformimino-5-aminoimidazole carboxamide ribotide isomerase
MEMATSFEILPAIDLRGGRVVRLQEGDFERETAYEGEPAVVATQFASAGARWLHVVDLDGARTGVPAHGRQVAAIVREVGERMSIEVAGGLRDDRAVAEALALGAARAVIGTAALRDATFAGRLVDAHGTTRIAVAIDVRNGMAVGQGWATGAVGIDAGYAIRGLADAGVETFEVTAIERDGLLEGPNLELYERLIGLDRGAIIASGGISSIDDIRAVRSIGCGGAIVGRALYEGRFELGDAMIAAAE